MLMHNGCVSPVIIPIGSMGEESEDPSLHKIFIAHAHFRGKDNGALHAILHDSLAEQYEDLLLHPDDNASIPEDCVDIIATTMAEATIANNNVIELKNMDLLYLLEYSIIYKAGGVSNPYASMEWPGIHIPHAISTMLNEIGLRFNFVTYTGSCEEGDLYFYDRNPAGRGLDFAKNLV